MALIYFLQEETQNFLKQFYKIIHKFMSLPVWGMLAKSQTDDETIEEAIARLIAAHESDASAHIGTGESLENHKAASVLDHPVESIAPNKLEQNFFNRMVIATSLQSLDAFELLSAETELCLGGVWINTSTVENNQAYLADGNTMDLDLSFDKDPILDVEAKFATGTNHDIYLGLGDQALTADGPFIGFKINNGVLSATVWDVNGANETAQVISGITVTDFNKYRIQYEHGVGAKFYINGVLKATLANTTPDGETGRYFLLEMYNRTAGQHLEAWIKPFSITLIS